MYKLICIDLDGTLLDSHQRVSNTNKEAIRKALDEGIHVAIVSGRPNCFTSRIIKQIDPRMGHVTFNGAYYRIGGVSKFFPIQFETSKQLAQIARKYNVRMYFKNKNLGICTKSDAQIFDYDLYKDQTDPKDRIDFYYYVDAITYFNENKTDVFKCFVWDENREAVKASLEEIKQLGNLHIYEYGDFFEMSSDSTSKGLAIQDVSKELGIKPEEVVCIGDNFNDVSMFKIAGLAVAMDNAPSKVKEMVDKVTLTNDEHGVAYAIENFVLKGE